jgi:hypothetical protein
MPIPLGVLAVAGAGGGAAGAYDLLETQVLSSSAASVTFTGLGSYSDYQHLQIRAVGRSTSGDAQQQWRVILNSDSGSNYAYHRLFGNGSSVLSQGFSSQSSARIGYLPTSNATANAFGALVVDVLDYANTSKNTTLRSLSGADTFSIISMQSVLWNNTAAVTSITLQDSGANNLATGSRFSLYGIK